MPAFLKTRHMVYICDIHSVRMRAICGPRTGRSDELFPHFVAKNARNSITEMLELFGIVIESHARYRRMFLIFPLSLYQVAALRSFLNLHSGGDAALPGCNVTSDLSDLFHLR